jgi:GntR family transcriptional regulator
VAVPAAKSTPTKSVIKSPMDFSIDHASSAPLHVQVEELLRQVMQDEEYQQGKLLPPEAQMATDLKVSRNTVRAAISRLVQEGLLERTAGVGTRVIKQSIATNLTDWASFTGEMLEKGIKVETFSLEVSKASASVEVLRGLGLPENEEIALLRMARVRGYNGIASVYSISWFHPRTGLSVDDDFSMPLYELIRKRSGIVADLSREEIIATAAKEEIALRLQYDVGMPILERRRLVEDAKGRKIEYNLNYYRGDRFTYSIQISRNMK